MNVSHNVPLQPYNSFGIVAKAYSLLQICTEDDAVEAQKRLKNHPEGHCVLGGGSNIVLTGDVKPLVLKMEILGKRLVAETDKAWIVEAGARVLNLLTKGSLNHLVHQLKKTPEEHFSEIRRLLPLKPVLKFLSCHFIEDSGRHGQSSRAHKA